MKQDQLIILGMAAAALYMILGIQKKPTAAKQTAVTSNDGALTYNPFLGLTANPYSLGNYSPTSNPATSYDTPSLGFFGISGGTYGAGL